MLAIRFCKAVVLGFGLIACMTAGCGQKDPPVAVKPIPTTAANPDASIGKSTGKAVDPLPIFPDGPALVDVAKAKPDLTLTIEELAAMSEDEKKAKLKDGKIIQLTGKIEKVWGGILKDVTVHLTDGKGFSFPCPLGRNQAWSDLGPGQQVTLRGRGPQSGMAVWNSVVIDKGPNPATIYAAEALAKDHPTERTLDEDKRKLKNFQFIVFEGEVVEKKEPDFDTGYPGHITLKGDGKVQVECTFTPTGDAVKTIPIGQRVRAFGQYSWPQAKADRVLIHVTLAVPIK